MTSQKVEWKLHYDTSPTNLNQLEQWLLQEIGIVDRDAFYSPIHPLKLKPKTIGINVKQLSKAVSRIIKAKVEQERVVIAGDYDADGICATAILWLTCKAIGIVAKPFIPDRHKHGYGLNQRSLPDLLGTEKPDLIITVDNGIVAHDALSTLETAGIDVIITDHHEKMNTDPSAYAIVHTTQLCGAGVAWVLAKELLATAKPETANDQAQQLLDLVAIATIADQVPLLEANRSFAFHGLAQLKVTERVGLQALFIEAGFEQSESNEWSISYQLAPRLNALGRLSHGLDALRLLCSESKEFAQQRARLLETTNTERRDITHELYARANQLAMEQIDEKIIIIAGQEFHEGIIGLLAGRLVEQYGKPAIVIAVNEALAKGSVRSIPGIHITEFLRSFTDTFLELGGHAMAAGFAAEPRNVEELTRKLQAVAREKLSAETMKHSIAITCPLDQSLISLETIEKIDTFAPFGQGNPKPLFKLHRWQVLAVKQIGKEGNHLKLTIKSPPIPNTNSVILEALWWKHGGAVEEFSKNGIVDLVGRLEKQIWRTKSYAQIVVIDAVASGSPD